VETDKQTDRHTDTETKYSNSRCTCAPRVNNAPNKVHAYRLTKHITIINTEYKPGAKVCLGTWVQKQNSLTH